MRDIIDANPGLRAPEVRDIVTAIDSAEYLVTSVHNNDALDWYVSGMGVESAEVWDYGHQES